MNAAPVKSVVLLSAAILAVTGALDGHCQSEQRTVVKTPIPSKTPHTAGNRAPQAITPYTAYVNRLRAKLDNKWYVVDGENKVNLSAMVSSEGFVTNFEVTSNPRNLLAEQAASDAFNQSQPLEALPPGSQPMKLTLVFDSYADPHGNNTRVLTGALNPLAAKTAAPDAATSGGGTATPAGATPKR